MSKDYSRSWSFNTFFCSKEGHSLVRKIHAMARGLVTEKLAKIDSNWHSLRVEFDGYVKNDALDKPVTDEGACNVEFDYRPKLVLLVGPNVGNVDLTEEAFDLLPEPLLVLMRTCDVLKHWFHTLYNPKHVIELIDGKTIINFENCTSGVVRNVRNNDAFDVESLPGEITLVERDQVHFTRASLLAGFEAEGHCGQPVDVNYFPLLPQHGIAINNVDDLREADRISREKWEADRPRREAEAAARRAAEEAEKAAAYAALSPEEKEKHDARQRRFKAQAELTRTLLQVLPGPGE